MSFFFLIFFHIILIILFIFLICTSYQFIEGRSFFIAFSSSLLNLHDLFLLDIIFHILLSRSREVTQWKQHKFKGKEHGHDLNLHFFFFSSLSLFLYLFVSSRSLKQLYILSDFLFVPCTCPELHIFVPNRIAPKYIFTVTEVCTKRKKQKCMFIKDFYL